MTASAPQSDSIKRGVCRFHSSLLATLAVLACYSVMASKPLGTDVSHYQQTVDWVKCKTNGIAFAYTKATEGTGYIDDTLVSHINGAKAQGIPIGLYHYARPDLHPNITGASSADSEAQYFINTAGPYIKTGGQYLIPMLDWEAPGITNTSLNQTTSSQWLNEWCYYVSNYAKSQGITMKVMVYSGTWYCAPGSGYNGGLNSTVTQWPNAMSGYPANPNPQTGAPSTSPWSGFTVWQYADTNWSGGDADVFNGTTNQLFQTLMIGGNGGPLITNDIDNVTVDEGSNATFSVGLLGTPPFTFRWYRNQTLISTDTTSTNFTVTNALLADAGNYYVAISNALGMATSSVAMLSIVTPSTNAPGSIIAPTSIVDFWPCQGNLNDVYGTNNLTPHGYLTYVAGKTGLGLRFDASTSYLTTSAASVPVPWTVSLWVNRRSNTSASTGLFSDGTNALKLDQYNGTHQVGLTQFGVGDYTFGYTTAIGAWVHLTFVGTASGTSLYANGSLVTTLTNSIRLPRQYIGADYVASNGAILDFVPASMDEIIVFNRALSATEITGIYNAGVGSILHAPELTSVTVNGNTVTLNMRGLTGKSFSVIRSPDMVNWGFLGKFSSSSGTLQYFDSASASSSYFYQVTQP
ncbi:MAG: hypothetical protein JWO95_1738 [Verrucomicrobiales bacterium]|nr:hypothetical protein [Verrucomicrobiales bacterium]